MAKLKCPFCGGEVSVVVCDDEGNLRNDEYENDHWSGLGYLLYHDKSQAKGDCPIAQHEGEGVLGTRIYDTRKEAVQAWNGESEE